MAQKTNIDGVRQIWQEQGADAADALFMSRESPDDAPTRWWMLGCELAAARADLPAYQSRWSRGWALAAQQPLMRQALAEALLDTPWDQELSPLWQQLDAEMPGQPNWRKQLVRRAAQLQRQAGARQLMARPDKLDNAGNWWPIVLALSAGEGDEPWVAAWMRHLDQRWLVAKAEHSNDIPDVSAFGRLDHWVNGGHAAVVEAWRALVPAGAWADWMEVAAAVARWRASDGLWSPCVSWPASVLAAWPKPVQRQALVRLALMADRPGLVRPAWMERLEETLARHWPPEAAQRVTAQLQLSWMHDTEADEERILSWLESKASIEALRSWWAPRALRECQRLSGGLGYWEDWCERFGTPDLGLGGMGHAALSAQCLLGRESQAQAMLDQWRQALPDPISADDLAWLTVCELTLAMHHQQHARAWQALNTWWQRHGLAPLTSDEGFSAAGLMDAIANATWPAPEAGIATEPVTAVLVWPGADDVDEEVDVAAELTLRSLQMQNAPGLSVLIVTDRELLDVATPPDAPGTKICVLRVPPDLDIALRTDIAIAAVETPWLIWTEPGSVWHPQALWLRQQHLARHPQAEVSQALQLAQDRFGDITVRHMRSGVPADHDGYMVRTQRLRALAPLSAGVPDGWQLIRERVERQLGALRCVVWPCAMGLQMMEAVYTRRGGNMKARHRRAQERLARQIKPVEEPALG